MKRVLISVSNDISTDQRLHRTCLTLREMGYLVLVVGRLKKDTPKTSLPFPVKRFRMWFSRGLLFYATFNIRLFFCLLFTKKDFLFANDIDTLLPNYLTSILQNKPLIFDSHELFSEVPELQTRPFSKTIWRQLENRIIPKLKNVITVSQGIQSHYKKLYNINPVVIRNVPVPLASQKKEIAGIPKKQNIVWYQGAVNIGRGLELMLETIPLLDNYIFVIVGNGDIFEQLEQQVLELGLENKVFFLGKKSPEELKQLTPNATVGISLEEDLGLNYRYALPNKIFDYIFSDVPVIVSNLPDMAALVKEQQTGEILLERTPESLAKIIISMGNKDYKLPLKKAKKQLHWSKEKVKLQNIIQTAF